MDKEYVVTLHRKEDLEQLYNEMQLTNFPLVLKRPLSRNTHYMMTEEQAEQLRQDSRVWDVQPVDKYEIRLHNTLSNEPYSIPNAAFWKDSTSVSSSINPNLRQWGHLHCAGTDAQRRKNSWGDGSGTENVVDTVDIFNNGKHVDVVIVDDPVSYDSAEWLSPSTGTSRFVQYQWFNELNTAVTGIDNAQTGGNYGGGFPSGNITYGTNAATPQYHGNHVTGTVAGQFYGWANEANIYNIAVTDPWPSGQSIPGLLIFDFLRAFHLNKPLNPITGKRNPTITNHSYSYIKYMPNKGEETYRLDFSDISAVSYRGATYTANTPGPSGWTQAGLELDFGIRFGLDVYPSSDTVGIMADVQDAIEDGVVVVGSAGNDNLLIAKDEEDPDWNNYFDATGISRTYYNRGGAPNQPVRIESTNPTVYGDTDNVIVGALSDHQQFRRSTYTNFGPGVTLFSPGDLILSSYGNTGFNDTKYAAGNYYYPISGTSMASPQVTGIAACLATGKDRFTNKDLLGYITNHSRYNDMSFDLFGGNFDDDTCSKNSNQRYLLLENPRPSLGYLGQLKGNREETGQTFPRVSISNTVAPTGVVTNTYTFSVGNSGASDYIFTGSDSTSTFNNTADPTIRCTAGDTLEFNISASGHPFFIKTSATTGTGNQVTTGTITNNGTQFGTLTWDTTGVQPATYYYICQYHAGMVGQIIIS